MKPRPETGREPDSMHLVFSGHVLHERLRSLSWILPEQTTRSVAKSLQSQSGVLARRRALTPGSANSGESMLYLANMCLGAPTALVS